LEDGSQSYHFTGGKEKFITTRSGYGMIITQYFTERERMILFFLIRKNEPRSHTGKRAYGAQKKLAMIPAQGRKN